MENWREYINEGRNKEVVSCIVFDENYNILIIRRSETDPWRPGFWDLPGGNIDPGETPKQTAIRETEEETNLIVEKKDLIPVGSKPMSGTYRYYYATKDWQGEIEFKMNPESGFIEHDEYKWVNIEDIKNLDNNSLLQMNIIRKAYSNGKLA
jgi:8-oxo-dGTP pyrophosphatase MutT (NUDIX family)